MATNNQGHFVAQPQMAQNQQQQPMFVSVSGHQNSGHHQQQQMQPQQQQMQPQQQQQPQVQSVSHQLPAGTAQALQAGKNQNFNLDEIFGDCFFTPEGETIFLSDQRPAEAAAATQQQGSLQNGLIPSKEGQQPAQVASRFDPTTGQYVPVQVAGGIATTHLDQPGVKASVMGPSAGGQLQQQSTTVMAAPKHHMGYITQSVGGFMDSGKKRRSRPGDRKMSDQQKVERRERNREHAKRSRIRKKFLLESLQQSVSLLKQENEKLRSSIQEHLGEEKAAELLDAKNVQDQGLIAANGMDATKVLDDPDFSFIKAIQTAQQNFVVTDPSLPDNPIVYATQGFLNLTGYTLDQVLGRNCRFLQGPETDPKAVEKIRKAIEAGEDCSVCLLNYRVDGTTFWNQFFIAALRDAGGSITNYVGVQCKVSDQYAANVCKRQEEEEGDEGDLGEDQDHDGGVGDENVEDGSPDGIPDSGASG